MLGNGRRIREKSQSAARRASRGPRGLVFAVAAGLVGLCVFASAAAASDWAQYGFAARHGSLNSSETTLSASNVGRLALAHNPALGTGIPVPTAPIVAGGRVFIGAGSKVHALDAVSGASLWSRADCSPADAAQPAFANARVYIGDGGGPPAAYEPATGTRRWCSAMSGSITSAPAVAGTGVYVTNGRSLVVAKQADGIKRWRFTPAGGTAVTSTPAVGGGAVYATGFDTL